MAEWNLPFAPPRQQAEETVSRQSVVRREWDERSFLICTHCRTPIDHGEQCMEFLPGVSGFGSKSGRPMAVDSAQPDFERAVLHIGCIYDYVFEIEQMIEYRDDEPRFCSGCEAKLSGDDG